MCFAGRTNISGSLDVALNREMARLLDRGRIRDFDYSIANKVLDHIKVTPVGKLAVIFLTWTRVTV